VPCTRWDELTESMLFHANLARIAQAPTEFRLLNWADPVVVGQGDDDQSSRRLFEYLRNVRCVFACLPCCIACVTVSSLLLSVYAVVLSIYNYHNILN
jgi:hypothetical protein